MGTKVSCHGLSVLRVYLLKGSLNGSITSNKGFINQFGNTSEKKTKILDGTWVSIWGGLTSTFQTIAPFCIPFVNDRFGRRVGLWVAWVLMLAVSVVLDR